jgi:hypothetical protein
LKRLLRRLTDFQPSVGELLPSAVAPPPPILLSPSGLQFDRFVFPLPQAPARARVDAPLQSRLSPPMPPREPRVRTGMQRRACQLARG